MKNESKIIVELKELYLFLKKLHYELNETEKSKSLLAAKVEIKLLNLDKFFVKEKIDALENRLSNDLNK